MTDIDELTPIAEFSSPAPKAKILDRFTFDPPVHLEAGQVLTIDPDTLDVYIGGKYHGKATRNR